MNKIDISNLPNLPGIYMFKGEFNKILYIGKAKSIKNRVRSYFSNAHKDWKINALLQDAQSVSFVLTKNEQEAILLEAQLIKDNQPKYNVLLRDGQPFIYYLITKDEIPKFEIVRNKSLKGYYIGPFFSKQHARKVFNFLVREFQLKICNKNIESGCLDYHIGICAGACKKDFDLDAYKFRLDLVKNLLEKNLDKFKISLEEKIKELTDSMEYEAASKLYKYLQNIESILNVVNLNYSFSNYIHDFASSASGLSYSEIKNYNLAKELKDFLKLDFEPHVIDCFDISHFQGKWIVGSCVRFVDGKSDKNKFRRFKIKSLTDQNDYAALQEIVLRRYKDSDLPDLVLIDGGKGQLSAVKSVFSDVECISIAKREETIFSSVFKDGINLDKKSNVGKLLMAIRDYAHHFAVSYHRKKRSDI